MVSVRLLCFNASVLICRRCPKSFCNCIRLQRLGKVVEANRIAHFASTFNLMADQALLPSQVNATDRKNIVPRTLKRYPVRINGFTRIRKIGRIPQSLLSGHALGTRKAHNVGRRISKNNLTKYYGPSCRQTQDQ